eukprot:111652-Chlamydomonas_euryale.AAC.2
MADAWEKAKQDGRRPGGGGKPGGVRTGELRVRGWRCGNAVRMHRNGKEPGMAQVPGRWLRRAVEPRKHEAHTAH